MPTFIARPTRVEPAGNKPIVIDEYVGLINTGQAGVSLALLHCPAGWVEPGQTPEFDEYTIVFKGILRVSYREGMLEVRAGQAVFVQGGEWVRYSTSETEGADYLAVCLPAYSLEKARRDI